MKLTWEQLTRGEQAPYFEQARYLIDHYYVQGKFTDENFLAKLIYDNIREPDEDSIDHRPTLRSEG